MSAAQAALWALGVLAVLLIGGGIAFPDAGTKATSIVLGLATLGLLLYRMRRNG